MDLLWELSEFSDPSLGVPPKVAYIAPGQMSRARARRILVVPGPYKSNTAVSSLQKRWEKKLTPATIDHDPYFATALLAMAQAHFHFRDSPETWSEETLSKYLSPSRDVRVQLITHNVKDEQFVVYTVVVSAGFSQRFACPKFDLSQFGLTIRYVKVPAWPLLGLKERLSKALGTQTVGKDSFGEKIETWEHSK
jgi:hypothetical protein